jgi:hypothetical protein
MTEEATSLDRWTIAAIAALAWPLADMLHEGGGHGGTALLLGVKASALTSAYYSTPTALRPCSRRASSPPAAQCST